MVYKPVVTLNVKDLPIEVQYRFAEIEMNQYLQFPKSDFLILFITKFVVTDFSKESLDDFYDTVKSYSFRRPTKKEMIAYLKYHNQSYKSIQDNFGISSATVAKYRFIIPENYPIYKHWNPQMLDNWNQYKQMFNLFNEKLLHLK